ncbi:hypothetical protein ColLi_12704 [Colletotrichum liriopes]|uniref:Ubiquitin-like protease family profile domain-containing protein n=1 Tax=Colletotrichum liriopes TaxID=708192 RepID=A0AA37GYV5_9PEZI|nr:hypothetical protein ColLi_12704 [Colletotrichum liriopes]
MYKGFVAKVASIPNAIPVDQLRPRVEEILQGYSHKDATQVSVDFVVNGPQLQHANKIVKKGLGVEERRHVQKATNTARRNRRKKGLPDVQAEVRQMCGGNGQLPDGTSIELIPFNSCKTLIRIIKGAQSRGMSVDSLWQEPNGILFDTSTGVSQLTGEPALKSPTKHSGRQTISVENISITTSQAEHSPELSVLRQKQQQPINLGQGHKDRSSLQENAANTASIDNQSAVLDPPEPVDTIPNTLSIKRQSELDLTAPASKRYRPNVHQADVDIERLTSERYLNDVNILGLLQMVAALCPLSVHVLDPLFTDGTCARLPARVKGVLPKSTEGIILAPLHLKRAHHWILAVPRPDRTYVLDSLPCKGSQAELVSQVNQVQVLLGDNDKTADADGDGDARCVVDHVNCTRQTNGINCGVAVIVNAIHILSGNSTDYNKPTDFAVWRRVLAALVRADACTSLVDKEHFAPLYTATPTSPIGPQPDAHPERMTASERKQWCLVMMDYVRRLQLSSEEQIGRAKADCAQMLEVLDDIGETLTQLRQAGTAQWTPGFSTKSTTSRPNSLSPPSRNEVEEAIWYYECAYSAFNNSRVVNPDRDASLMRDLDDLQRLNARRSEVLNGLDRVIDMIAMDVKWLRQLRGPTPEANGKRMELPPTPEHPIEGD